MEARLTDESIGTVAIQGIDDTIGEILDQIHCLMERVAQLKSQMSGPVKDTLQKLTALYTDLCVFVKKKSHSEAIDSMRLKMYDLLGQFGQVVEITKEDIASSAKKRQDVSGGRGR